MFRFQRSWLNGFLKQRLLPTRPVRRTLARPRLTCLEDRTVPTTFTVTGTGDAGTGSGTSGDLRYCIAQANANSGADVIDASGVTGTITLSNTLRTLEITDSVTISGPSPDASGQPRLAIKSGLSPNVPGYRILDIGNSTGGLVVALSGLSIQGGFVLAPGGSGGNDAQGGGIRFVGTSTGNSLTLTNCAVTGNKAYAAQDTTGRGEGGGLFASGVALTMQDSTISGNSARGGQGGTAPQLRGGNAYGGGLYFYGPSATLSRCTITGNTALGGNAGSQYVSINASGSARGGTADGGGLDAVITGNGSFGIADSQVTGNTATGGAAASKYSVYYPLGGDGANGGMDVVTYSTTKNGSVTANGVATDCTFANNTATGGAATNDHSFPDPLNSIRAFGGAGYGGGVTVSQMFNCTVFGNSAVGGMATSVTSSSNVVVGPAAGGGFGGSFGVVDPDLSVQNLPYSISNCTIAGNTATSRQTVGGVTATGVAVAGGVADGNAVTSNIQPDARDLVRLYSTLVASNLVNPIVNGSGTLVSDTSGVAPDLLACSSYPLDNGFQGHNLIGFSDSYSPNFAATNGYDNAGNPKPNGYYDLVGPKSNGVTPYDPGLVLDTNKPAPTPLLAWNGGFTQTVALQSDSNAIDNGGNNADINGLLQYDQRGYYFSRGHDLTSHSAVNYYDGTDVGSFEQQPPALVYVDTYFTTSHYADGFILDADPVQSGYQPATIGVNAFSTVSAALAAVADGGEIIINGNGGNSTGDFSTEAVAVNQHVALYLQQGSVTFGSLSGNNSSASIELHGVSLTTDGDGNNDPYNGTLLGTGGLTKVGTHSLTLGGANTYTGATTVSGGTLKAGSTTAFGNNSAVTLSSGGTLSLNGYSVSIGSLAGTGGTVNDNTSTAVTLTVGGNNTSTTYSGVIVNGSTGALALTKVGTGTLTLGGTNTYSGGTNVQNGTLSVSADANLGTGNVTGGVLGVLAFSGTTTTTKSFAMDSGTINAASGITVTFNGGTVSAAYLDGSGTYATSTANGALFQDDTSTSSANIASNSVHDQFHHFSNSATLTVAAGINDDDTSTTVLFNDFTNQGTGSITISQNAKVNVADFESYGNLTLDPGTTSNGDYTLITNVGSTDLAFNSGSVTTFGTAATYSQFPAGIDLHGYNAHITGGLVVNDGFVVDSVGAGNKTIISDYGSLVEGYGFYQNSVQEINGGRFKSGMCPGVASFGNCAFGAGAIDAFEFYINDATGVAGPTPDSNGQVSGHSLINTRDFSWAADAEHKLTVDLKTLTNPTTIGNDVAGPMANFDPTKPYTWEAVHWTGTYTGPTDVAALNASTVFDTSGFANSFNGTFSWQLDLATQTLSLVYTPNP
jgi:autotransporter-associated beta strand protein